MAQQATEDQHRQLAALILTAGKRKDWDKDKLQLILDLKPIPFNEFLTATISNYEAPTKPEPVQIVIDPPTGPLVIDRSNPFNPAKFIGSGWPIWQDARSLALTEVDFTVLTKEANFLTSLEGEETYITGEVKRVRLIAKMIQADVRIGQALYEETGQTTLRWLFDTLKISWFELLGTTLRDSYGYRCAWCLFRQGDGSWRWDCSWLGSTRGAAHRALSFAS